MKLAIKKRRKLNNPKKKVGKMSNEVASSKSRTKRSKAIDLLYLGCLQNRADHSSVGSCSALGGSRSSVGKLSIRRRRKNQQRPVSLAE